MFFVIRMRSYILRGFLRDSFGEFIFVGEVNASVIHGSMRSQMGSESVQARSNSFYWTDSRDLSTVKSSNWFQEVVRGGELDAPPQAVVRILKYNYYDQK